MKKSIIFPQAVISFLVFTSLIFSAGLSWSIPLSGNYPKLPNYNSRSYTLFQEDFDTAWTNPRSLMTNGLNWDSIGSGNTVWHRQDFTTGWTSPGSGLWSSPYGAEGTSYSARFHSYTAAAGTSGSMITPLIDFSGTLNTQILSFHYRNSSGTDSMNVYLSTDGGANYGSSLITVKIASSWTRYTVNLGAITSPQVRIKFTATSDDGTTDIGLDQIYVFETVPLTGNKTIRTSGGDYSSVKQAVDSLNLSGVGTGGVTFLIQSGAVFYESPIIIDATGSAGNPVVFKKENTEGAKPVILVTGTNNSDACFRLNGSDYITFDNLELRNAGNSSSTYTEYGFYFLGGGTNGCRFDTVKNCTIKMSDSISSRGVYLYSSAPSSFEGSNSFNAFINDSLIHCYNGYYFENTTATQSYYDSSNTIRGDNGYKNVIRETRGGSSDVYGIYAVKQRNLICTDLIIDSISATTGDSYGIYISGLYSSAQVYGNSISGVYSRGSTVNACGIYNEYCVYFDAYQNTVNKIVYYGTGSGTATGIYSNGNSGVVSVHRNKIYGISAVRTSGYATGLYVYNGSLNLVNNNVIFDIKADSSNSTQPVVTGIKISGNLTGTNVDSIFHNTVYINYTPLNAANESAALYVQNTYPQVVDLRNNIFVNNSDVTAGNRAIAFFKPSGYSFGNISTRTNNNLYYAGTPGAKNLIFKSGVVEDKTLEEYKVRIATKDMASVTENPVFRSLIYPYNLNIDSLTSTQIESGGRKANSVTTDFNGLPRYPNPGYPDNPIFTAFAPDIGAFEFGGVKPSISGTYYIGGGKDFPDLISAVNFFNSRVMTGPVNFVFSYSVDSSYINSPGQFPITINANGGSSPSNRLTIKPDIGVSTIIEADNSTAVIKLNGADYITIDGSGTDTTSRNLTIKNNNTSAPVVFVSSLGTNEGARCNIIRKCNITGGLTTSLNSYGIFSGGLTPGNNGDSNDSLIIENNSIYKSGYGIYAGGSTEKSDSLFIRNNSIGSQVYGEYIGFYGIYLYGITTASVSGNRIFNMKSLAYNPTAISINNGVSNAFIVNNKIDSIIFPGFNEGYGGKGIVVNTGNASSNITIANNVIYKIFGDGYSSFSSRAISGISIGNTSATGGINIWYNSLSLTGNCTNSSLTLSACLYLGSGSTNINIKNNSFFNSIVNVNNSSAYSFAVYSVSSASAFSGIDYNNYYTEGSQGYLGYLSGIYFAAGDTTGWRAATSQDAGSKSINPEYSNNENNLRPDLTSPLLSAGVYIPDVTNDYLGTTRSLTSPSMGAYETGFDFRGPVIVYTSLSNTTSLLSRDFQDVSITDRSSGVDSVTRPRVYYKRMSDGNEYNNNSSSSDGWKYSIASGTGGNPYLFTIDYTRLSGDSGVSAGTVIQYFVVAQDLSPNHNVGINSAVFSEPPVDINLTSSAFPVSGTIKNYKITGLPMSGIYTVGYSLFNKVTGKEIKFEKRKFIEQVTKSFIVRRNRTDRDEIGKGYLSRMVHDQIDTIIQREINIPYIDGKEYKENLYAEFSSVYSTKEGVKDNLILEGSKGVYARITDAVNDINERGMSGPVTFLLVDDLYGGAENFPITINTNSAIGKELTIKPAAGVNAELYGFANCIMKIYNHGSVIIDGSNETGGTSRNFIIESGNVSGIPIWIGSADSVITDVTVKNCVLSGGSMNNGYGAVNVFSGNTMGLSGKFSDIKVINNYLSNASIGVYFYGQNNGTNNVISDNFIDTAGTGTVRDIGICVEKSGGTVISGNNVLKLEPTEGTDFGIYVTGSDSSVTVEKNRIGNIGYTGTFGYGGHGISTDNNNGTILILNNEIFNMYGDGWDYTSFAYFDNPVGIFSDNSNGKIRIINNSLNLYGNTLNQDEALSCGMFIGTYYDSVVICNNSIINNLGAVSGGNGEIASGIYFLGSYDSMINLNFNNYWVTSSNTISNNIAVFNDLTNVYYFANMTDWNSYSGKDINSYIGNPGYLTNTNLFPDTTNSNCWVLYRKAMPFTEVPLDIRGLPRSTTVPNGPTCIGAYEFTTTTQPPTVTASGTGTLDLTQFSRKLLTVTNVTADKKSFKKNENVPVTPQKKNILKSGGTEGMSPNALTINGQKFSGASPLDTTRTVSGDNILMRASMPLAKTGTGYVKLTTSDGNDPAGPVGVVYYYGAEELGNVTAEGDLILAMYDIDNKIWVPFVQGTGDGESNLNTTAKTITVTGLTRIDNVVFMLCDKNFPLKRLGLDLTVLLEGFYNNTVNPPTYEMVQDTVWAVIYKETAGPVFTRMDSMKVVIGSAGTGFGLSGKWNSSDALPSTADNYWLVIRHRNAVESWSALGTNQFSKTTGLLNYNFTTAQTQTYGSNAMQINGKWCLYEGDANQDGTVDIFDLIAIDNDNFNFVSGVTPTDLNGDQNVDIFDLIIGDNNNFNFIGAVKPPGALIIKKVRTPEQQCKADEYKLRIDRTKKDRQENMNREGKETKSGEKVNIEQKSLNKPKVNN